MKYEIIKYFDIFGTRFHFYTDERPRLYTIFGGIASITSIFVCFIIFLFYSLDDLERNSSIISTSILPSDNYHKIRFNEEKLWLPFRIVDNNNKINHHNLIYPIIYYYENIRNDTNSTFESKIKILKYKLCNETSMINKSENYKINVPLDQLFCIEVDNLEIGGSWTSTFLSYIKVDFYLCENGIFNNSNFTNCNSEEKIIKNISENSSLEIEFYYPVVHFQQINQNTPIIVLYKQHFYHINKYSNKIDRLYLKEYILNDDLGWILKNDKNFSFWGLSEIKGDSYFNIYNKDLINEVKNPIIYSMNIFSESEIVFYKRKYKKIIQIIVEGLPVIFAVYEIFVKFVKLIKLTEENTKLIGLLFENLQRKKTKLINLKKILFAEKSSNNNNINLVPEDNSNFGMSQYSSNVMNKIPRKKQRNSVQIPSPNKLQNKENLIFNHNPSFELSKVKKLISPNKIEVKRSAMDAFFNGISENSIKYEISKLFPSRYYFFVNFLKNFDIVKMKFCFSKKFTKVYTFLGKMIDFSSYLKLIKEFEFMKNKLLKVEDINMIERSRKINVNERMFMRNMNECIENGNFVIFSQNTPKKFK